MTTPTPTVATCCACGTPRDLRDLLVITDRHDTERPPWYCCRPSVDGPRRDCLARASGPAADYAVALAVPPPPPVPHPLPERPALAPHPVMRPAPALVQPFRPGRLVASDATGNGGPW
jgi:hypothetical protein